MNITCLILFWISIIFIAVSSKSAAFQENPDAAVCYKSLNRTEIRRVPSTRTYTTRTWWTLWIATGTFTETIYESKTHYVSSVERTCCEGYKNQSGVCEPECSSECKNGNCTQPNICTCNHGWEGVSCDEPLLCVLSSDSTDKPKIQDAESPQCVYQRYDRLGRRVVNITDHANAAPCLLPLDCRISAEGFHTASWKKYVSLLCMVAGIALLSVAIYTVYTVRRKRIAKEEIDEMRSPSGIPLDYMVDNTIYS